MFELQIANHKLLIPVYFQILLMIVILTNQPVRECPSCPLLPHSRESGNPVIPVISTTYLDSRFRGNEEVGENISFSDRLVRRKTQASLMPVSPYGNETRDANLSEYQTGQSCSSPEVRDEISSTKKVRRFCLPAEFTSSVSSLRLSTPFRNSTEVLAKTFTRLNRPFWTTHNETKCGVSHVTYRW